MCRPSSCRCSLITGTRHLLHTDPTASLSEPSDFMVAGGGNGYSYFVVDASTEVLFDGVEFAGLGRLGDGHPALSLLLPGAPRRRTPPPPPPPAAPSLLTTPGAPD